MSYINTNNPRRMIWFNQNAPKNKMDLWLSYNKHYEDTSDDETTDPQEITDNHSQRNCDLILKAWDCGQWIPIVGFNTTAANKIDTVEGNTLYHPAIFTGENPNDLYDAGSLGSLLSNPNFVTELEWHDVFNSSNYDWGDIFGDTNWFGDLIWETIQGGSSTYHLPLATYEKIGGARILTDTTTLDYRGVPVLFGGPNAGLTYGSNTPEGLVLYGDSATYNPDNSFLYVPAWAIMDIISNPTGEQTPEPMIRNGFGTFAQWNIDSRTGLNYCTISLQCTPNLDKGKYLRINSVGTDIEWADVQGGESYISGTGIDIQNNEISIDMTGAETDNVLVATSNSSVMWAAITYPTFENINNTQTVTFIGNNNPGYKLKPNRRYYCTSQIQAISLYSYSTPIFIPSIIEFVTSVAQDKPLLRFDSSYEFIETHTVNSTSYSTYFSYDSTYNLYTIALKPETKYIVTINGNKISVDEISDKDTLFNVQ